MEFSKQIVEILNKLAEQFGLAIDWTSKNVAPYIETFFHKYTTYNIVSCIVGASFGLLFLVAPAIIIYRMFKNRDEWMENRFRYTDSEILHIVGIVICVIFLMVGAVVFPIFLTSLIKWICIPELQIVEAVKDLLSNN